MRKIILMMSVSLDGFFEGPDHELDWQLVDDELHSHFNEQLAAMGGFLDGRITYELMAGFWPTADTDPSSTAPMVEFARIWREMPKTVFSRTLTTADWNTTVVSELVVEDILALKAQPGGDLAVGGADLAASFIRHDLIDEWGRAAPLPAPRPLTARPPGRRTPVRRWRRRRTVPRAGRPAARPPPR